MRGDEVTEGKHRKKRVKNTLQGIPTVRGQIVDPGIETEK